MLEHTSFDTAYIAMNKSGKKVFLNKLRYKEPEGFWHSILMCLPSRAPVTQENFQL